MSYSEDANYAQTVGRALDIMELFQGGTRLSLTAVAQRTNMSTTAAFRLLHTLCLRGYLTQLQDKTYALGDNAIMLGLVGLHERKIVGAAHGLMWDWYAQTGHTVAVSIIANQAAVIVNKIHPFPDEVDMSYLGYPLPLHRGASQRVMLAFLPEEERTAYVESLFLTPSAKAELYAELENIRERGYDYTAEQVTKDLWAIAFPIFERSGKLAGCVGTSGYVSELKRDTIEQRVSQLRPLIARIQQKMNMID